MPGSASPRYELLQVCKSAPPGSRAASMTSGHVIGICKCERADCAERWPQRWLPAAVTWLLLTAVTWLLVLAESCLHIYAPFSFYYFIFIMYYVMALCRPLALAAPDTAMDFIGDIVERTEIVEAKPPEAPAAAPSRAPSKWKSRKQAEQSLARDIGAGIDKTGENFDNHSDFERENLQRVQTMSPEEVEEAKSELLAMDPKLLDVLAKRAKKQEMESQTGQTERQTKLQTGQTERQPELKNEVQTEHQAEHQAGPQPERQLDHQTGRQEPQEPRAIHFPKAPPLQLQDLAPDQLHEKFYPDLETEPEKMAWMQPLDDDKEAYSNLESVASTELRFDFAGDIISPRQSSAVPTHLGLHHHGDQPAAAGYTIPELAHLARSTVASQRSLAIRTLGRVVYKLGNGRFGSEIGAQLWALVDQFQVKEALVLAESQSSSVSVQAYAQEALWLMQQSKNRRPAV